MINEISDEEREYVESYQRTMREATDYAKKQAYAERVNKTWPPKEVAENVLEEANRIVSGDRRADYGNAYDACDKMARLWSVIVEKEITPKQFCLMMICMKVARECQGEKRDNLVDIAGYARVAEMVLSDERSK